VRFITSLAVVAAVGLLALSLVIALVVIMLRWVIEG
jgi:hypothetical protein